MDRDVILTRDASDDALISPTSFPPPPILGIVDCLLFGRSSIFELVAEIQKRGGEEKEAREIITGDVGAMLTGNLNHI